MITLNDVDICEFKDGKLSKKTSFYVTIHKETAKTFLVGYDQYVILASFPNGDTESLGRFTTYHYHIVDDDEGRTQLWINSSEYTKYQYSVRNGLISKKGTTMTEDFVGGVKTVSSYKDRIDKRWKYIKRCINVYGKPKYVVAIPYDEIEIVENDSIEKVYKNTNVIVRARNGLRESVTFYSDYVIVEDNIDEYIVWPFGDEYSE